MKVLIVDDNENKISEIKEVFDQKKMGNSGCDWNL